MAPIVSWLRRHDPELNALHKAIKVAIVVTVGLAIGTLVIGNPNLSLFASFGGVAFLLFADFPGNKGARFGAYLILTAVGAVLITLGTLASAVAWTAVLGMLIVGFLVLFSGVLSAASAAGTRAALLTFILPVTVPGTAADIPARLGGWGIAAALAIPVGVLLWPPRDHDALRARAADACRALGRQVASRAGDRDENAKGNGIEPAGSPADVDAASAQAIVTLRQQFRGTTFRPVGLTTGSRLLVQLIDRLEWLRAVVARLPTGTSDEWPATARELVRACAAVLDASATALDTHGERPAFEHRQQLATALRNLDRARAQVIDALMLVEIPRPDHQSDHATVDDADPDTDPATDHPLTAGRPFVVTVAKQVLDDDTGASARLRPSVVHELYYTTRLAGQTVAVSAASDARPLIDRLLGRQTPSTAISPFSAARRIVAGHITRQSVWFQNSVRGALGLSLAVLLAEVTGIAHGFWVVLAAMSVLRSSALTTGSTALRALIGTFVGFLFGAGLVLLLGTEPTHLWAVLPFVVVVAAFLPEAVSFAAGQAAFTVMVVILFNIIEPVGWTVGLVRVEDIAMGCAAGLVCGILFWPRGAAAQIRNALAESLRSAAGALVAAERSVADQAVDSAADPSAEPTASGTQVASSVSAQLDLRLELQEARSAASRLDDAFREYLAERGSKPVPVDELTTASNGATRIRLA
ncbi:MAG TPA: FUSC family protein, partial [Nakamurella sp.]